ncbi:VOC family protein [Glutamicibacter endophyticus]
MTLEKAVKPMRLHHVQLSMPASQEAEARRFYGDALGLDEVEKPPDLRARGGCWFRAFDGKAVVAEIHLGVEEPFLPARKAHPALVCASAEELEAVAERIAGCGYEVSWAERDSFEGYIRFHARDGFGNRLEIMAPENVSAE